MPYILADLPDDDIRWRDLIATTQGKSRDVVLGEIVRWYAKKLKAGK